MNTLISIYQPNVALDSPAQVYDAALRGLGAETLLTELTPVEVVGEQVISLTIPAFRTWRRYQILPDSPLTVTFLHAGQVMTPVVAGTEYTLFQPQAGNWQIRLQGEGLAYYRQVGEGVANPSLYLRAPEEVLVLGEDVIVRAGLIAEGVSVTDLTLFTVTATINNAAGITGLLSLEPDEMVGLFAAIVPSTWFKGGVHSVTLAAKSSVPGVHVQPVAREFEIVALPTLAMTVTPTEPILPGQSVYMTVTVGNWRPGYVPEGWLVHPDGTTSTVLLRWQSSGTYVAHTIPLTRTTALVAQVARPRSGSLQVVVLPVRSIQLNRNQWWVILLAFSPLILFSFWMWGRVYSMRKSVLLAQHLVEKPNLAKPEPKGAWLAPDAIIDYICSIPIIPMVARS